MGLETGTLPADLVTTNPTAGDPVSQADDHMRLIKVAVKNAAAGPAFSAYQSVLQAVPDNTFTKILFQTEEFDSATAFDSVTNYRFTPLVAGYYLFTWSVGFASSSVGVAGMLYKNGGRVKDGVFPASGVNSGGSALVYMNGTTDYAECYGYQNSGGSVNTLAISRQTFFQAFLARLA